VKEMSFKSGMKDRGSDRWWERRWWLWWGDAQDEVNQEDSEHNEVDGMKNGADFTEWGDAYLKQRLVVCNTEEDTDGRARVTTDEERVHCRLNRDKIVYI